MKKIIFFFFFSLSAFAFPLREKNPVTLRLGSWQFIENSGHYQKLRNIKKVCHESEISNEKIIFNDCPHIILIKKFNQKIHFEIQLKGIQSQTNLTFHFKRKKEELFYGGGTQYSFLSLNDQKIEFLSQEQGKVKVIIGLDVDCNF